MSAIRHDRSSFDGSLSKLWHSRFGYRLLREALLIGSMLMFYKYVRYLARDASSVAMGNAQKVLDFERSMGLAVESQVQSVFIESRSLISGINAYYVASHFVVTIAVMVWLYFLRAETYRRMRWVMVLITLGALAVHVVYPLAPPRMMGEAGLIDTLKQYGPSIYPHPDVGAANQFAAMPSLHFGYAAMAAWGVISATRTRWRWVMMLHPAAMLVAIMATANHFVVDAVAAMVLLIAAISVVWSMSHNKGSLARREHEDFSDDDGAELEAGSSLLV